MAGCLIYRAPQVTVSAQSSCSPDEIAPFVAQEGGGKPVSDQWLPPFVVVDDAGKPVGTIEASPSEKHNDLQELLCNE